MKRGLGLLRSLVVYWRPGRQRALRRLYAPMVGTNDLVFDIGAHLGDRSAAFAALGARVIAFEPQPHVARLLQLLVGRNERITIRPEAVGAREGSARLAVSTRTPTLSTLSSGWAARVSTSDPGFKSVRWDESLEVSVVTLDALIEAYGVPRFCKIDVEGHEAEVLAGLSRPLPGLSFEFLKSDLANARRCVHRIDGLGRYEFNAIRGEERTFVLDEWTDAHSIVAWLDRGAGGAASGDIYARMTAPAASTEVERGE